ncbi:hypothetical protein Adt_00748 [Abeliophyllum distichum]|uniref:Uncharacterized protein n=1 Tax=Abeliophyllum distichum TaxID=126358 RepID=A0ABD1VQZ3_9LAMI
MEEIPLSKSMQETDESEETVSLCDLPMYSDSAESHGSNSLWTSHHDHDHDQDCFEFFSEEWNSFPPENIVFCGKLIPSRKPISENPNSVETKMQSSRKWRLRRIFRWKLNSFHRSGKKIPCNKNKKLQNISSQKSSKGHGYPFNKVSILTSSSSGKSRWYLFLFGITRFPTEMELRDMKNRQSRRRRDLSPPMFQLRHDDEKINVGRSIGRGLWGLIKALSCSGGHQTNTVVAAPVSCIPPPSLKL